MDPTEFGGRAEERALAVRLHQSKKDIPTIGVVIDGTALLARVADDIVRLSAAAPLQ
jgi:hypothetical protein